MDQIRELEKAAQRLDCEMRRNEPMSRHTTFQIGGPADLFLTVHTLTALRLLCRRAAEFHVRLYPVGNGSNLLVSDAGIRGGVVSLDGDFKKIVSVGDGMLECGSGVLLSTLCSFAKDHALTGMEFAWGIPGRIGGAALMNAGAYEHSMSEVVVSCSHITPEGEAGTLKAEELEYGYRHSSYSENDFLITSVRVQLQKGDAEQIEREMAKYWNRRKAKQPLELPSAGSVFKRPPGYFAGGLIEQCGLKGQRVGGAMVSEKHAGFIVNTGGATCEDVKKLISVIQETVFRRTGVRLECEIKQVG